MTYYQKGDTIEKRYFSIGEVAEILDLSCSKIRFWLTEFHLMVGRKKSGYRIFTEEDIANLEEIKRLVHDEGYTLKGALKKFKVK